MHQDISRYTQVIVTLLMLIIASPVFALSADHTETIHIIADSTTYNYKTGFTIFDGHVKVDQGTTHITADRLTTQSGKSRTIKEAIAYGYNDLAHYWTLPTANDPVIHAQAKIIKFYPTESNVALEKDVTLVQGANSFQGQLILYNRNEQTIFVPEANQGRAVVVINPDNKGNP